MRCSRLEGGTQVESLANSSRRLAVVAQEDVFEIVLTWPDGTHLVGGRGFDYRIRGPFEADHHGSRVHLDLLDCRDLAECRWVDLFIELDLETLHCDLA